MTSRRKRNDFINFIIDATQDEKLAQRFFNNNDKDAESLYRFFRREGYKDIPFNDCDDILIALQKMRGRGVNNDYKPVDSSRVSVRY